ncbi:serine--tRNA ligase [Rhodovibrio sodomensis]|uniref:Serine--tRNA ligase n=1 Tax=Rhodovibrio sodomensis TaxID=1088 RepID=A0ABS1DD12_9PROT|nr:serine--tRNA ligase [Rhodovibrio sodomensis]MBK1668353.1 serine--tRNA ligase [Rhodovibrio sodomensis]
MHDLKWIREQPDTFDAAMARRGLAPQSPRLLELDRERRRLHQDLQEMQTRRNEASKEIGQQMKAGEQDAAGRAKQEVADLKRRMGEVEAREQQLQGELDDLLAGLPNALADDVPDGEDDGDNVLVRSWGTPHTPDPAKQHFELGEATGEMDFELAAKLSGSRFVVMKGEVARLHRALGQFMVDLQSNAHGYQEVNPPVLLRDDALYGTGQLPKFGDDLFRTTNGFWLSPTAEVPLTNLMADEIVAEGDLPIRYTALTLCFRAEAGAAGKDTRGMLRQHQFEKCEMVSIAHPDTSWDELERMVGCAEAVLQKLELPYRVVTLCSGDTGAAARKTYDLEVWLPGQGLYREISSCSNTGDYQARRMKARYRPAEGKGTRFVHTLNGSGIAVGRALIAVLENHQQPDGSVRIPEALRPYMGGRETILAGGTPA